MATRPDTVARNLDLESAVDEVKARYVSANPASRAQYERAKQSLPGGNTRTGMFYTPFPLAIEKAAGATLIDVDGHTYTDFVGDFSAGLYGHSHPVIREALMAALDDGMAYGSSSPYEERLATLVCARFSSIEQVRFTNSGTEANTMALVTARAVSGKDLVMVFEGAYHGGTIYFGRKSAPINMPFPFLIAPYNDAEEATRLIAENADRLACVLAEPMQGASGAIPGDADFLRALREACTAHGVLLIFDEVMTSRVAPNGRQGQLGITPDMTTARGNTSAAASPVAPSAARRRSWGVTIRRSPAPTFTTAPSTTMCSCSGPAPPGSKRSSRRRCRSRSASQALPCATPSTASPPSTGRRFRSPGSARS